MLQLIRLVEFVQPAPDPQSLMLLARNVVAATGVFYIVAVFILAIQFVRPLAAAGCAALAGFAPMTVVHAHYLKEDMVFSLFVTLSLAALCWLLNRPAKRTAILFGVLAGMTVSAKYAGILIFVLGWFALRKSGHHKLLERHRKRLMKVVVGVGAATFLLINYPLMTRLPTFVYGLAFETNHMVAGHTFKLWPIDHLWTFHIRHSLVPGLTIWAFSAALLAIGWLVVSWRRQSANVKMLLLVTVLFYLIIETLPLKPFPGFARYAMPLIGPLAVLLALGMTQLVDLTGWTDVKKSWKSSFVVLVLMLALLIPAYNSSRVYADAFENGTRSTAGKALEHLDGRIVRESYAINCDGRFCPAFGEAPFPDHLKVTFVPENPGLLEQYDFAVVSSFQYERFFLSETLVGHTEHHEGYAEFYRELLCRPRLIINSDVPRFAFFEPTIHIVDLKGNGSALEQLTGRISNDRNPAIFESGCGAQTAPG